MEQRWHILQRDGSSLKEEELPERPADSNPDEGESFRPWYKQDEHLHIENGQIVGIHAKGSLEKVQSLLKEYLQNERKIVDGLGGNEDQLLPDVDAFLGNNK